MSIELQSSSVVIYGLVDPRSGGIFYVGKTKRSLPKRLSSHRKDKLTNSAKRETINDIILSGLSPEIKTLENCHDGNWEEREVFWIAKLRSDGIPLTNRNKGGAGTHDCSSRTRDAISLALQLSDRKKASDMKRVGVRFSDARISAIRKGVRSSPKYGAKIGTKLPDEWCLAISRGRKNSVAAKAQLDSLHAAKKGVPRPAEVRDKIREALRTSERAVAARKLDSERKKGTPQSPEMKAGIAEYNQRRRSFKMAGFSEAESRKLASKGHGK